MDSDNESGMNSPDIAIGNEDVVQGKIPTVKKARKKWPITIAVIAIMVVVAGAGMWVWHEQPSFCNAICHTPMDAYNRTYNEAAGAEGTDKYGNAVQNTNGMLAVSHRDNAQATCMSCHVPQISEQVSEGINWITGNYEVVDTVDGLSVPAERTLEQLVAARGITADEFCLNAACHANEDGSTMTRDDLIELTSDRAFNPHVDEHNKNLSCDTCHKAHRASVLYCADCHDEAELPEGWITPDEEESLSLGLTGEEA